MKNDNFNNTILTIDNNLSSYSNILFKDSSFKSKSSISDDEQYNKFKFLRNTIKKRKNKGKINQISKDYRFAKYDKKLLRLITHDVYRGIDRDRGCDIIWNEIKLSAVNDDNKRLENIYKDILNIKKLDSIYINSILDTWIENEKLVFITDSSPGNSLRMLLGKIGFQKKKIIKSWIIMILNGLKYLHLNNKIYKYLNCGRIIYNPNTGSVSIGDIFLISNEFSDGKYFTDKVNPYEWSYPAPEVIDNKYEITEKADIFSLGMIIIEIITLEFPYSSNLKNEKKKLKKINYKNYIEFIQKYQLPLCINLIPDFEDLKLLIIKMISWNPNERPSIDELLSNEILIGNRYSDEQKLSIPSDNMKIKLVKEKKIKKKGIRLFDSSDSDLEMKNFFKYYVNKELEEKDNKINLKSKEFLEPYENELKYLCFYNNKSLNTNKLFRLDVNNINKNKENLNNNENVKESLTNNNINVNANINTNLCSYTTDSYLPTVNNYDNSELFDPSNIQTSDNQKKRIPNISSTQSLNLSSNTNSNIMNQFLKGVILHNSNNNNNINKIKNTKEIYESNIKINEISLQIQSANEDKRIRIENININSNINYYNLNQNNQINNTYIVNEDRIIKEKGKLLNNISNSFVELIIVVYSNKVKYEIELDFNIKKNDILSIINDIRREFCFSEKIIKEIEEYLKSFLIYISNN